MNRSVAYTVALLLGVVLSGCATPTKMAFENDTDRLTAASKPVFLMTATIKNTYKESYQPRLLVVNVEKSDVKDSADRINFTMDDKAKNETDALPAGNSYVLRMELPPGNYEIRGLTSMARSFPVIGTFFTPLHAPLRSGEAGVFYLGHVTATVRERQGNEFKAGASIPLIDQAVVGAGRHVRRGDIGPVRDRRSAVPGQIRRLEGHRDSQGHPAAFRSRQGAEVVGGQLTVRGPRSRSPPFNPRPAAGPACRPPPRTSPA